jgi:3-oxoacyl-[acyl-carrier-protein] synthase-3
MEYLTIFFIWMDRWKISLHARRWELNPPTHETVDKKMHYIYQDGRAVFKVAVVGMADVSAEIVERKG